MRAIVAVIGLTGCSFVFTAGPATKPTTHLGTASCSGTSSAPVADFVLAAVGLGGAVAMALAWDNEDRDVFAFDAKNALPSGLFLTSAAMGGLALLSGGYGLLAVGSCRSALAEAGHRTRQ